MTSKRKNLLQSEFNFILLIIFLQIFPFLRSLNYNLSKNKTEMFRLLKTYKMFVFFSQIKNKD